MLRLLVTVVIWLVGALFGKANVIGLFVGEDGQLDVELLEVSASDFFIQRLGQDVDTKREVLGSLPEGELGENLVGEGTRHDEGWVSGGASEVDETTFGEEDNMLAGWHGEPVHLGFYVDAGLSILLQPSHVDLNVEVTNVGDDSVIEHDVKVLAGDDVPVTGGGDEDVGAGSSVFHGGDFVAGHGSLESIDWVDLGDENSSTVRFQRLSTLGRC